MSVTQPQDPNEILLRHKIGAELLVVPDPWIAPTLQGLWINYGAPHENAGYYKDALGIVHLKGLIRNGTGLMFTLPVGYRPAEYNIFPAWSAGGFARIDVESNGDVIRSAGSGVSYSLANITFRAEQ